MKSPSVGCVYRKGDKVFANLMMRIFNAILSCYLCSLLMSCNMTGNLHRAARRDLLQDSIINHGFLGVSIYEPARKKYWYQYQSDKYFIPASNVKLFTLYAGLQYLGDSIPAIEYALTDSVTWIRPTGDPTLLHPDFPVQRVISFLRQAGRVNIDWPGQYKLPLLYGHGWQVEDVLDGNGLPRTAMPVYGNEIGYLKKDDDKISVDKDNGAVSTKILSDVLQKNVAISKPNGHLQWVKLYSRPADSIYIPMMHRSDNFFAEQVLLMAAQSYTGSMDEMVLIDSMMKTKLAGIPRQPRWADGSGLSRYNLFTPASMVYVLEKLMEENGLNRMKTILPTGGEGTLKNYFKADSNYIFAKSGTLGNNQALSGYLLTKKGKWLIFSIMVNHYRSAATPVRRKIETFLQGIRDNY